MIRAVLFDYGDTLVRAKATEREIMERALEASHESLKRDGLEMDYVSFLEQDRLIFQKYLELENLEHRDVPDFKKYIELVGAILPQLSESRRRQAAQAADEAFWRAVASYHGLQTGTKSSLKRLAKKNLRLAVVSNHHNPSALRTHLAELGIAHYFTAVLASSEFRYRKPDPRIFRRCLSQLGVRGVEAAIVGDSLVNDIGGGKGVGMLTILVEKDDGGSAPTRTSEIRPDFVVSDLRRIPEIVESANRPSLARGK